MEAREERVIRVFDLFISICQRWRALLICLVVGAVVLGAYGWLKSGDEVAIPTRTEAELEEAWAEVLSPGELDQVHQLYATILEYDLLQEELSGIKDMNKRLEYMEKITSGLEHIASVRNLFSEDQKAYLAYLTGDTSIVPGNKDTYTYKDNVKNEKESVGGRRINKKYILIGALGGLILAALIILIKYIAASTIRNTEELEETFALPVIARFDGSSKFYDKRKTRLDKWLRKVKQRNKNKISPEENIDVAVTRIQIASQKQSFKKFCIAVDSGVIADKVKPETFLEDIAAKIGADPEMIILKDVLKNTESMQRLSEADGGLLVVQTENSRFNDVLYENLMCRGYGVEVIGAIVVE